MAVPFLLPHRQFDGRQVDSIERPLRTITAQNGDDVALVEPFLVPFVGEQAGQAPRVHPVDAPLPTVTGQGAGGLVDGVLIPVNHRDPSARSVPLDQPVPTLLARGSFALVQPLLVKTEHQQGHGHDVRPATEPLYRGFPFKLRPPPLDVLPMEAKDRPVRGRCRDQGLPGAIQADKDQPVLGQEVEHLVRAVRDPSAEARVPCLRLCEARTA